MTSDLRRRARLFRIGRIAVLALVIAYFLLPYGVRSWFPVWLLFLLALGLEIDFFVGGWLQTRRGAPVVAEAADRGPQERDLSELGSWGYWDPSEPTPPIAAEPSFRWLHVVEAVAAIAIVGTLLYFAARPNGWNAVSTERQAQTEAILSREASAIAHHPATVTCDKSGDYVGFVQDADGLAEVGGDQAFLTPEICDTLYQLAIKHRVQSFSQTARAIAVLGHESWHLRGERSESLANCYGFQSGVGIGVNLGLSRSRARAMMQEQLATNASDSGPNTQYRVPSDCRVR
jgi:hypothetical protein